ncbi:6-phosphogluconolactonase [Marinobacter sp. 1Y8]
MKTSELHWPAGLDAVLDDSADVIAHKLAKAVAERLTAALGQKSRACLAVSGGSTPKAFFQALSQVPLDWSRIDVTLADERWVDVEAADSNERLVREGLMQGPAASARFIGLKQPHDTANAGQPIAEEALSAIVWPLDVLVLGMGNDGHTASLFPDAPEIDEALDSSLPARCIAMHPPSQAVPRISLTRRALDKAEWIAVHLKGADKLETLERAFGDLADVHAMPIRAFLGEGTHVYWSL